MLKNPDPQEQDETRILPAEHADFGGDLIANAPIGMYTSSPESKNITDHYILVVTAQ
ncbi:hypothetical protein [Desulfonatronum parangueonense]